jgi:mono/diheme cytochrome c family protein
MFKKAAVGFGGFGALAVLGLFGYVETSWDKTWDVPLPDLQVSTDPEVIEKGRYLVHGPAHCSNCHVGSFEEMARADAGEDLPLAGGAVFPMGPLGKISVKNLTPDEETGLGRYSDGQVFRMLRHAIRPDGTASLSLIMPFQNMADEDHVAIVSYLRSLEPVRREVPDNEWTFMGKVVRTFLPPFEPVLNPTPPDHAPPMEATVERGEYIARHVANCYACHTQHDMATFERTGPEWAGGSEIEPMPLPGVDQTQWFRTPNLTPHPSGVLKNFPDAEAWIKRFRVGRTVPGSPMHWGPFSRMSDEDLTALYLFFNSLEPVDHEVGAVVFTKEG